VLNLNTKPLILKKILIWLVLLTQVWTHYIITWFSILSLKKNCNDENYSKFIIPCTLCFKIMKLSSWNLPHWTISNKPKARLEFSKFVSFDLLKFQWQNRSILDNSCTIGLNMMISHWHTAYSSRAFSRYQEHNEGCCALRDFILTNITNKQTNKQITLLNK